MSHLWCPITVVVQAQPRTSTTVPWLALAPRLLRALSLTWRLWAFLFLKLLMYLLKTREEGRGERGGGERRGRRGGGGDKMSKKKAVDYLNIYVWGETLHPWPWKPITVTSVSSISLEDLEQKVGTGSPSVIQASVLPVLLHTIVSEGELPSPPLGKAEVKCYEWQGELSLPKSISGSSFTGSCTPHPPIEAYLVGKGKF